MLTGPSQVKACPLRPDRVGSTQSTMSTPRATAPTSTSGFPTPIRHPRRSSGSCADPHSRTPNLASSPPPPARPTHATPMRSKAGSPPGKTNTHHYPARDRPDQIVGFPHPQQIARPVGGQLRRCEIEDAEHRLLPLADREAADRIAVEADGGQRRGRTRAQPFVERTLLDAEQRRARRMRLVRIEARAAARGPA